MRWCRIGPSRGNREHERLRLDGYIRVSRVGGRTGDSFISPEVQREQIESWAKLRGVEIANWETDLDQSGGTMDRPGLERIMERIRTRRTGGIVVARLDRFARSLPGAVAAIKEIEEDYMGTFACLDLGLDPTTPEGKMFRNFMLALAQFERDRITQSWSTAQARAIERGMHFGGVPAGYDRGDDGRLVPNDDASPIGKAFTMRAEGCSWVEIRDFLNERVKPPKAMQWTERTVAHVIKNRAYLGEAYHGEHRNPDAHPGLVSREVFDRANVPRDSQTRKHARSLLAGLIRCHACRYRMRSSTGGGYRIYACRVNHGAGRCPSPATVTERVIDDFVTTRFLNRMGSIRARAVVDTKELSEATERLEAAERELAAFRDDLDIRQALGHDSFVKGLRVRADAVDEARAVAARAELAVPDLPPMEIEEHWPELEVAERRTLLTAAIDCVVLRRTGQAPITERATILWHGEGPRDLPGLGIAPEPIRPFAIETVPVETAG